MKLRSGGWSEQEIDIVREMAAADHSASEISDALFDRSRNAVIGLCHRKGIDLSKTKGNYRKRAIPFNGHRKPVEKIKKEKIYPDDFGTKPYHGAANEGCSFIVGDPKNRMFCGNAVVHGSYCLNHARVCYRHN